MDKLNNTPEKQQSYNAKFYQNRIKQDPEFYAREKERVKNYIHNRYQTDEEFKERLRAQKRASYHKMKALKMSQISVN